MTYDVFHFLLVRKDGCCLSIKIREDNPLYSNFLNTLCGKKSHLWIGNNSHHKVIRLDPDFKDKLKELIHTLLKEHDLQEKANTFFIDISSDEYVAFLRFNTLEKVDDSLIKESIYLINNCNTENAYDCIVYDDTEANQFTGPSDLRQCTCRFCGESYPTVKFKKENAHALPDSLGNKLVFCNDECIRCNGDLSVVEKNLINYLNFRRAKSKIPSKKGKIITNTGQNYIVEGKTGHIEITNEAILGKDEDNLIIKHLDANLITHLGIYRALCKIAIDLLPNDRLSDFTTTISWIKGSVAPHTVPNVYYAYRKNKKKQPIARVYVRKTHVSSKEYPHCLVILDLIDLRFYYIIPFAKSDDKSFISQNAIERFMPFLTSIDNDNIKLEYIDMSQREGKYSHVIDIKKASDTIVVDSSKFENAKEKNPNKVDFPELDVRKIEILNVEILKFNANIDHKIRQEALLEYSDIRIQGFSCNYDKKNNGFSLYINLSINDIATQNEIFNTQVNVRIIHNQPDDVCSMEHNEVSFHLVDYMINLSTEKLYTDYSSLLPNYNFNGLKELIVENTLLVHPKDRIKS